MNLEKVFRTLLAASLIYIGSSCVKKKPGVDQQFSADSQPNIPRIIEKELAELDTHPPLPFIKLDPLPVVDRKPQHIESCYLLVDSSYSVLYFFKDGEYRRQFPVALGSKQYPTRLGKYKIVTKVKDPSWTPPAYLRPEGYDPSQGGIPAGPNNPIKWYWIGLKCMEESCMKEADGEKKDPGIGIHGSENVVGYNSHGCIRMEKEALEYLAENVPVGTYIEVLGSVGIEDVVF